MRARRCSAWRSCARRRRRARAGLLSLCSGLLGLGGLAGLAVGLDFGLGAGVIERIAAYPFPLWLAAIGVWLLRGGSQNGDGQGGG